MKILMLVNTQIYRGTYWRAFRFAQELKKLGHEPTLICTSSNNRWKTIVHIEDGVELVQSPDLFLGPLRSGWDLWNTFARIQYIKNKEYDLIHAFESRPVVIFPAISAQARNVPLVMDWADWFGSGGSVEERKNPVIRGILRPIETFFEEHYRTRANATTVICSLLFQKALDLGIPEEEIIILRNGADTKRFSTIPIEAARKIIGIPVDIPSIGYVGSIFTQDAQFMVEAFEKILLRSPGARLIVAGYCPYNFRDHVSQPAAVIQTGFIQDEQLNQYLSACNIFWLPLKNSNANRGRFPYKLTDYMALGRPVVATEVGDITDILKGAEIGVLSPDAPDIFAKRTLELLGNPELMDQMGRKARILAETHFSWEKETNKLESLYNQLILEARRKR